MAEKFKISNLDLYYGDFHALKNILSIQKNTAGDLTSLDQIGRDRKSVV